MRLIALLALFAIAGCSAEEVHSPLAFFPGAQRSSWSDCDKFGLEGSGVQVCAALFVPPTSTKATYYSISISLPQSLHVSLAVFDSRAALVKVLVDRVVDFAGPMPDVVWDFTDAQGHRVPSGDYRCYLSAGDFLSFSDVEVP